MRWDPQKKDHVKVFEYEDGSTEIEGESQMSKVSIDTLPEPGNILIIVDRNHAPAPPAQINGPFRLFLISPQEEGLPFSSAKRLMFEKPYEEVFSSQYQQRISASPQQPRRSINTGTPVTPANGEGGSNFFPQADSLMALGQYHQQTGSPVLISFGSPGPISHRTPSYGAMQPAGGNYSYGDYQTDHISPGGYPSPQTGQQSGYENTTNYSHQGQGMPQQSYYGNSSGQMSNPSDPRGRPGDYSVNKDQGNK